MKATKKQVKEYETLQKKHAKERLGVQSSQCKTVEKAAKSKK